MTLSPNDMYMVTGGGFFAVVLLLIAALADDTNLDKRLDRVGSHGNLRKTTAARTVSTVRSRSDSSIPLLDSMTKLLPNPDKMRDRLQRTGKKITLGEYMLINAIAVLVCYLVFTLFDWDKIVRLPLAVMAGLFLPHAVTGFIGNRRIKKFLANFPEAIDTMCRGIRSGLPITESINAVGREMPDPIGIEFSRITSGVRMGQTVEAAMWEVVPRIDTPEFRFLIIAMGIQKETGGNLAETLGNLAELIRKRRQLRLKVKAMSSEAKASAMIIGSLPFIMFVLLSFVNPTYMTVLTETSSGKVLMGIGLGWMAMGWGVMIKMINFEL